MNTIRLFLICLLGFLLPYSYLGAQQRNGKQTMIGKANESEIHFTESSWDSTIKKASAAHKYIFVDAYASWCGPCKLLKTTTFRNKEAALFFNQHFINLSIDLEKGEGPDLAAQWQVEAYPTLLIFTADGKLVLQSVGFVQAQPLIAFGKEALTKKTE